MINKEAYLSFSQSFIEADQNLLFVANKFPEEKLESYEKDDNGNFTARFSEVSLGGIQSLTDPNEPAFKGVTVKVDKVVKGKFVAATDSAPGRVEFTSGVRAEVDSGKRFVPNANVSLKSVQAVANSTDYVVKGAWGPISKEVTISQDQLNLNQIQWKA